MIKSLKLGLAVVLFLGTCVNFGLFLSLAISQTQITAKVIYTLPLSICALLIFVSAVILAELLGFVK